MSLLNRITNLVQWNRLLGNKNVIRTAGNTAIAGDPAGMASHDFANQYAVVRLGCRVQSVDRLSHDVDRGVETECEICSVQVIVDSLRHTDNVETELFVHFGSDSTC